MRSRLAKFLVVAATCFVAVAMTSCVSTVASFKNFDTDSDISGTGTRVAATCEEVEDPYIPFADSATRRVVVKEGDGCVESERFIFSPIGQGDLVSALGQPVVDFLPESEVNEILGRQAGFVTTLQDGDRLIEVVVRTRTVLNPDYIRENGYHVPLLKIVEIVVDCEVGAWSEWVTSGTTRTRTRALTVRPSVYGRACPELEQTSEVGDCVVSDWGAWTQDTGDTTMQVRMRVVIEAGTACPALQETKTIVDCAVGAWGSYAFDPIGEELIRSRTVTTAPTELGSDCPHLIEEVSVQDCRVGAWGAWVVHPGDATMQLRIREVEQQPSAFGEQCPDLEETKLIVDCVIEAWGAWVVDPNDNTMQSRVRLITTQPTELGTPCPPTSETGIVGDCELSDWGAWTMEDATTQIRTRSITQAGTPCSATMTERKPLFNCEVGAWGDWVLDPSDNTKELRVRPVTQEPSEVGTGCAALSETQPTIDCVVGDWGAWSQDTDPTLQVRTRLINTQASLFGEQCPPASELTETLPLVECGFSDWFAWSLSQAGTVQTRNRVVTQTPSEAATAPCGATTETCTYTWGSWGIVVFTTTSHSRSSNSPSATVSGESCPLSNMQDVCTYVWTVWTDAQVSRRTRRPATASLSLVSCPENGLQDECTYGIWEDVGTVAIGEQQPQTRTAVSRLLATSTRNLAGDTTACTVTERTITKPDCVYGGWQPTFAAINNNNKRTRTRTLTTGGASCRETTDTCTYAWGGWSPPTGADSYQERSRAANGLADPSGTVCPQETTLDECRYSWDFWLAIGDSNYHVRQIVGTPRATVSNVVCELFARGSDRCTYTWNIWEGEMTQTRTRRDATASLSLLPCPENGMMDTCVYTAWGDDGAVEQVNMQPQTRTATSRTLKTSGVDVTTLAACNELRRLVALDCVYGEWAANFELTSNSERIRTRPLTYGDAADCTETTDTCTFTWQTWPPIGADNRQERTGLSLNPSDVSRFACRNLDSGTDVCTYEWDDWPAIGANLAHTRPVEDKDTLTATLSGVNCPLRDRIDRCTYGWGDWEVVDDTTEERIRLSARASVSNVACPEAGNTDTCVYGAWMDSGLVGTMQTQDRSATSRTVVVTIGTTVTDAPTSACDVLTRIIRTDSCEIDWGEWDLDPTNPVRQFRVGRITTDGNYCPQRSNDDNTMAREVRAAASGFFNVDDSSDNCQYIWGPWTGTGPYQRVLVTLRAKTNEGNDCPTSTEMSTSAPPTVVYGDDDFGCGVPHPDQTAHPDGCAGSYPGGKELLAIDYEGDENMKIAYRPSGTGAIKKFILDQNAGAKATLNELRAANSIANDALSSQFDSLIVYYSLPSGLIADTLGILAENNLVFLRMHPHSNTGYSNSEAEAAANDGYVIFAAGLMPDGTTPVDQGCDGAADFSSKCILAYQAVLNENDDTIDEDASNPLALVASAISQISRVFNLDVREAIAVMFAVADTASCTAGASCGAGILDVTDLFDERGRIKAVLGGNGELVEVPEVIDGCVVDWGEWSIIPGNPTQEVREGDITLDDSNCPYRRSDDRTKARGFRSAGTDFVNVDRASADCQYIWGPWTGTGPYQRVHIVIRPAQNADAGTVACPASPETRTVDPRVAAAEQYDFGCGVPDPADATKCVGSYPGGKELLAINYDGDNNNRIRILYYNSGTQENINRFVLDQNAGTKARLGTVGSISASALRDNYGRDALIVRFSHPGEMTAAGLASMNSNNFVFLRKITSVRGTVETQAVAAGRLIFAAGITRSNGLIFAAPGTGCDSAYEANCLLAYRDVLDESTGNINSHNSNPLALVASAISQVARVFNLDIREAIAVVFAVADKTTCTHSDCGAGILDVTDLFDERGRIKAVLGSDDVKVEVQVTPDLCVIDWGEWEPDPTDIMMEFRDGVVTQQGLLCPQSRPDDYTLAHESRPHFVNVDKTSGNCQYVWGPWTNVGTAMDPNYQTYIIILHPRQGSGTACQIFPPTGPSVEADPYDFGCGVPDPDNAGQCVGSYPGGKELRAIGYDSASDNQIGITYYKLGSTRERNINRFVLTQTTGVNTGFSEITNTSAGTNSAISRRRDELIVSYDIPSRFFSGERVIAETNNLAHIRKIPTTVLGADLNLAVSGGRMIFAGQLGRDGATPAGDGCASTEANYRNRCILAYQDVLRTSDNTINTDESNSLAIVASAIWQIVRVFNTDITDAINVMFAVADKTSCTAGDSCGAGILDVTGLFDETGRIKAVLGGDGVQVTITPPSGSPVGTSEQKEEEVEYEHDLYELGYISLPGLEGDVSVTAINHYVGTQFNLVTSSRNTEAEFDLADTDLRTFGKQEGFGAAMSRDSLGYCRAGICSYLSQEGEVGVKHFVTKGFEYSVSYKKTDDFFGGEATGSLGFGKTDNLIAGMKYRYDIGNNLGLSLGADVVHGRAGDGRLLRDLQGTLLRPNLELKHKASLTSGAKRTTTFSLQQKDFVGSFNVPDAKHKLRESDWEVNLSFEYRY